MSDTSATLALPDGRTLGYATWGEPAGVPVIFFHGCPGSRFNARSFHTPARDAGILAIAPERPGYGLSSPSVPRHLTRWPSDVEALADSLGLERFHLAGASGGGPHALVCAAKIPQRLESVTVVSSLSPFEAPGATEGMDPVLRRLWTSPGWIQHLVARATAFGSRWAPDSALIPTRDLHALRFFDQVEIRQAFLADMRESLSDGGHAMAAEVAMLSRPWGFELSEIEIPVRLWHGELDANCPRRMADHLALSIPKADATIFPGEGHMCAFERLDQFFAPFLDAA